MSEIVYALDLDEDLLAHLPSPDAWLVLNGEQFDPLLIEDDGVRDIFCWQRAHLREHGVPATATVLDDEFELDLREPETVIGDLIDRLRERYAKNQGRQALRDIVETQRDDPAAIPQLLLKRGRELNHLLTKHGEMFGSGDAQRAQARYDKKVLAGPGAGLFFSELTDYFFGMRGVTMVLAPPKTMKSWLMCQGVVENIMAGHYPWICSLELPAEETDMRIRCLLANVPWWRYIRNCLTPEDWDAIHQASAWADGHGAYRIVKPPEHERGIDAMVYKARDAGADVIFIDQLQYVETSKGVSIGALNNTGDYWEVLNRARDLSDDGPICFAHQFNRSAMYADSMPLVEQAKGSSSIEEVATLALGIWANKDMRRSHMAHIGTLIARNHEYASWEMEYDLAHGCSFEIIGRITDDED